MPKTLASMVFTSDGTSVEAALKNIGGGGTPSGDGGNVKVTNASSLRMVNYYAFKPSKDGSVEGAFSTIPIASASNAGLMSSYGYEKLDNIKTLATFSIALASLTNNSTSEEILQAFEVTSSQPEGLLSTMLLLANAEVNEYDADYPQAFIGNSQAVMRCTYDSEAASGTMELTYVAAGGKLRTITISGKRGGTSPDFTYTYSCAVTESGDDTYYLPSDVYSLKTNSTHEDILAAFGGSIDEVVAALKGGKRITLTYSLLEILHQNLPVTAAGTGSFLVNLSYYEPSQRTLKEITCNTSDTSQSKVKVLYTYGYSLKAEVYSLTSSSDTDTISTAVGGESGLKAIIQAVKNGNRLVIRGTLDDFAGATINQDVQCSMYVEGSNGDMQITLFGKGYLLWGATGGVLSINYTKSSNTFSCVLITA